MCGNPECLKGLADEKARAAVEARARAWMRKYEVTQITIVKIKANGSYSFTESNDSRIGSAFEEVTTLIAS